jgi:hypothetical protein
MTDARDKLIYEVTRLNSSRLDQNTAYERDCLFVL